MAATHLVLFQLPKLSASSCLCCIEHMNIRFEFVIYRHGLHEAVQNVVEYIYIKKSTDDDDDDLSRVP